MYYQFIVLLTINLSLYSSTLAQHENFKISVLEGAYTFAKPVAMRLGPDGMIWATDHGRMVMMRIDPFSGEEDIVLRLSCLGFNTRRPFLGFDFHKNFGQNSQEDFIYVSLATTGKKGDFREISRFVYSEQNGNGQLGNKTIIIDNIPQVPDHDGGKLVFGPDSKLYYTIGDGAEEDVPLEIPTLEEVTQRQWKKYLGKILRINLDGSIPDDNPAINGVRSHIYSYGHRNPQGLIFDSQGNLYSSEHGPSTDDEVNLIKPGANYGWPAIAGYIDDKKWDNETTTEIQNHEPPLITMFTVDNSFEIPNYPFNPTSAPSSIGVYESDVIPGWKNSILVSSLKRGMVHRLKLSSSLDSITSDTINCFITDSRYRDLIVHPNGRTFYLVSDVTGALINLEGTQRKSINNPGKILVAQYQDAPNQAPKIIDVSTNSFSNLTQGIQVAQITATDGDNDPLNHSISSNEELPFRASATSGKIYLDLENAQELKAAYDLRVQVEDGFGGLDSALVSISLNDVKRDTIIQIKDYAFWIRENIDSVIDVSVIQPYTSHDQQFTFEFIESDFQLNQTNMLLSIDNGKPFNYEQTCHYTTTLIVKDEFGNKDSSRIEIYVQDQQENPSFVETDYFVTSDFKDGDEIGEILLNDPDGDPLNLRIFSSNRNLISIESDSESPTRPIFVNNRAQWDFDNDTLEVFKIRVTDPFGNRYDSQIRVIMKNIDDPQLVSSSTEIHESAGTVYPNPFTNSIHISSTQISSIEIQDLSGKTLVNQQYQDQLDLSKLPNGLYILQLIFKNMQKVQRMKIVKK